MKKKKIDADPSNSANHNTPTKILVAARELFVEHGFSGTSMGQIALKAGVNHSLIFHHFGNKQKLWQSVKDHIIEEGRMLYEHMPSLDLSFTDFLKELVSRATEFFIKNPDIVKLVNWQRVESSSEVLIGLNMSPSSIIWINACKFYQQKNDIDKKLRPEFVITFILALVASFAMDPNAFLNDPKLKSEYTDFCINSIIKSLKP